MNITTIKASDYATPAAHGFAWFTVIGGVLTLQDWALILGMVLSVVTCVANIVFKILEYRCRLNDEEQQ